MARPSGKKTRCSGAWTEARFKSFVKGLLRAGTQRWAPIQQVRKRANIRRGVYKCESCNKEVPPTVPCPIKKKRIKNVFVDHIVPVVPPEEGFTTWDNLIEGMFSEVDNLWLICKECHDIKTKKETDIATERRRNEKLK